MTKIRTRLLATSVALLVIGSTPPAQGQATPTAPDPDKLAQAGHEWIRRFETQSASWTATMESPTGIRFIVDVEKAPTMRRIVLSAEARQRTEFARIIERDGAWYVEQMGRPRKKYRPYETPFDVISSYFYLTRADLRFVVRSDATALGPYVGTDGGIATYRTPLSEPVRRQLEGMLADRQQAARRNPGKAAAPELVRVLDLMKGLIERGIETRIDVMSGLILQYGTAQRRTRITDLRWNISIDPRDFAVDGQRWEDHTDDPTAGDRGDLLMIGHSPMWRPGVESHNTEGVLFDLKTGRSRRIPFRGAQVIPGCFLADRTRVAVSGVDPTDEAMLGLYEIDLKTGANRKLGGKLLAAGIALFPVLSPDGKTLAVVHKGPDERQLDSRLCLVDVKSGEARPLGTPHDMAFPSWLPDGSGLVLLIRVPEFARNHLVDTIVRMDLDGKITTLREGSMPVVLGDGRRILFRNSRSNDWRTCDLEGHDEKPYADGLKGYAFPAPAPDGKRILMMHFQEGSGPVPKILPIDASRGKPASSTAGLWALPSWR